MKNNAQWNSEVKEAMDEVKYIYENNCYKNDTKKKTLNNVLIQSSGLQKLRPKRARIVNSAGTRENAEHFVRNKNMF